MSTTNTSQATGGIISSNPAAAIVFGTDPTTGFPTATLPPIVIPFVPGQNQASPGDIAVVRAHDVQSVGIIDATFGNNIDTVPQADAGTYKAMQGGVWARVDKLLIVAKKSATAPANPTTIAGWYDSVNDNGTATGNKVPYYQ